MGGEARCGIRGAGCRAWGLGGRLPAYEREPGALSGRSRALGGLRSSRGPLPEAVPRAVLRWVRAVLRARGPRRRQMSRARRPARDRRGDELVLPPVAV